MNEKPSHYAARPAVIGETGARNLQLLRAALDAKCGTPEEDAANLALEDAEARYYARVDDIVAFQVQNIQDFAAKCAILFTNTGTTAQSKGTSSLLSPPMPTA